MWKQKLPGLMAAATVAVLFSTAEAQLRITEVMFDSDSPEPRWEWFEVQNTGSTDIDLNGGYFRDMAGDDIANPNINNTLTANTIVPAGAVGVVFNAANQDHTLFRQAWGLGPSVPLVGVAENWSSLNNGGDTFGIWTNTTDYVADLGDGDMDGDFEVVQFNNALTSIDYNGFPDGGAGVSTYWLGTGDITDATQWAISSAGTDGAYQSTLVTTMNNTNSTDDAGNPGVSPGGSAAGLHITEIMYNPRSADGEWEWIEVVNNTGNTIDFGSGDFFLDDAAGGNLGGANITSGTIPDGGVALLFNDDLPAGEFNTAWGSGLNTIPVSDWPALNNSNNATSGFADQVSIWDNLGDYENDRADGAVGRAEASVTYENAQNDWPNDDGNGSISLTSLSADPTLGLSWNLSVVGDGLGSFNASGVGGIVTEHNGNDFGSPGLIGGSTPVGGDFDGDGDYACADVDALVQEIVDGTNTASFDLTGDGLVNNADLTAWLMEAGDAEIGVGRPYLDGDANLDGVVDVSDFNIWNGNNFSNTAAWCSGDFNADGAVDVSDFNIWNSNNFNSSDAVSHVPEPGSLVLLLAGLPLLLRRRR